VGQSLYLKGKVQTRFGEQWEYKVASIQLLPDIRNKLVRAVSLSVDAAKLTSETATNIEQVVAMHPGKCSLNVVVISEEEKLSFEMVSRKYSVSPSNELLDKLAEINGVACKLI
jgi:DNA polymerase III subunit alpha